MRWIWQQPDWPDFRYDNRALDDRELEFRISSERLAGRFEALPMASQEDATIDLMLSEAIKTSAIEGEDLDRESVRSSLLSLITSDTLPDNSDQKAAGAASLLVDVRKNWHASLTHDLLGKWQSMAIPEQRYTPILRGAYRNDPSPMQIVSGPYGREKVHYEAPPVTQVPDEMTGFIGWYNQTSPSNRDTKIPGIARAGIAHLWFEVIHPFDDGNGRVGRAIADHALSQSLGYPTTACLATAIEGGKKSYYLQLEKASRGSLDVNAWLDYFADRVIKAQEIAREEVDFVLAKARFYETYGDQLNDRQARMVSRVLAEGRKGFEGGITTKKYEAITKCPNRTASRDLSDLVAKRIIVPLPGGGRTTRYELAVVEPAGFGLEKK
ncbi:MAG: Fic family protein [Candidatus Thiodiazotropha taylori]|nr:Fic family protein [Candidatus Thiodiazotropha taylori]MCW4226635.1 Fic family protein [Candidatus Thiodiazotropha endolucinida]MCG7888197.1 Fic family protein [Candidatus Thiodiazotropha taylori]MCG7891261.1 Fic family protein [Candidatus Thiodiazotropha taylori]MCG7950283.1 Fic family protein [Candidatus Thiodiazotropha taylori]